ncbi:MAG: N-6 DNA methylase [Bryobacteraceae bacterium]
MRPQPGTTIIDPAAGTGGFLLAAASYIIQHHKLDRDQLRQLETGALFAVELVAKPSVNYGMVLTNPPDCDVHTLLRLPTGIFYAQGVIANVLFFDRKPASKHPWTRALRIYDLRTNKHFTLKTHTLARAGLDDFVRGYNPANRHERAEPERFHQPRS